MALTLPNNRYSIYNVQPTPLSWFGTDNNNFFNMPNDYFGTQANINNVATYGVPNFSTPSGRAEALGNVGAMVEGFEKEQGLDTGNKFNWGGIAQAAGGAVAMAMPRKVFDDLDPMFHLAGGRHSAFGNGLSDAGVSLFKSGAASGNPQLMLAGGIVKAAGGLFNAGFGYNIENEQAVKDNIGKLASVKFNARDMDTLASQFGSANMTKMSLGGVKNGWFNHTGTKKAAELSTLQNNLYDFGNRSFSNALGNIGQESKGNFMRNYFAWGGPLDTLGNDIGPAASWGLAKDYLTIKQNEMQNKNKMNGISPSAVLNNAFALGGDVQTHGGDFTTGISRIDSGGYHETNPNEGVQIGVDPEGNPNLVEEGEVIYNDFVYSNRIKLDNEAKEAFHFSKKRDLTYAEAAKKLEKESSERPNDPISQAALEKQMEDLAQHQERQKQEMEAERAQEEFASLSPEEQVAVMQQLQQGQTPEGQEGMVSPEQQAAQEQAMQEQAMQEQAMAQQGMGMQPQGIVQGGSPEEAMAMQQMAAQEVPQMAYGGNIYAYGGNMGNRGLYSDTGNLFPDGGTVENFSEEDILDWVNKELSDVKHKEEIAKGIYNYILKYHDGKISQIPGYSYGESYKQILRGIGNLAKTELPYTNQKERAKKHFRDLLNLGMSKEAAFDIAFPAIDEKLNDSKSVYHDLGKYKKLSDIRNSLYQELVETPKRVTVYTDKEGKKHNSRRAAEEANFYIYQKRANAGDVEAAIKLGDLYAKGDKATKKDINKALNYYEIAAFKGNEDAANKYLTLAASMVDSGNNTTNTEDVSLYNPKSYASTTANTSAPAPTSASAPRRRNGSGLYSYSGYNGPMGTNAPLGFTVDSNGNVTNYSDEYRNYVNNVLTADALRNYINNANNLASTDSSYASYLNSGNVLNNLTDAQLRSGALDGNYGFLHNMANALYEDYLNGNPNTNTSTGSAPSNSLGLSDDINDTLIGRSPLQSTPDNAGAISYWDWGQGKYVKRPVAKPKETKTDKAETEVKDKDGKKIELGEIEPILSDRNFRQYLKPMLPGLIGLAGQLAIGKQDYTDLEKAANIAANVNLVSSKSVGTPIIPKIQSPFYTENPLVATSNGLDRVLANSTSPSRDANRITNAFNTMRGLGEAALQMNKYNDTERDNAIKYNNELAKANEAERFAAESANANILNSRNQFLANARMNIERGKLEDEADYNNNLFANASKIVQGILDRDRELDDRDTIARLVASGVFGNVSPENLMASGWIRYKNPEQRKNGGKIKRNKRRGGLTF